MKIKKWLCVCLSTVLCLALVYSVAIADNGVDAISKLTVEDVKNRIVTTVTMVLCQDLVQVKMRFSSS